MTVAKVEADRQTIGVEMKTPLAPANYEALVRYGECLSRLDREGLEKSLSGRGSARELEQVLGIYARIEEEFPGADHELVQYFTWGGTFRLDGFVALYRRGNDDTSHPRCVGAYKTD